MVTLKEKYQSINQLAKKKPPGKRFINARDMKDENNDVGTHLKFIFKDYIYNIFLTDLKNADNSPQENIVNQLR